MAQLCLAPDPNPASPSFTMPASATDCRMHMFGTAPQYPYVDDRDYTPPEANVAAVRKLYTALGIQRIVAIQPSVYGTDNRCQLEFAAALGMPFRAIIVPAADVTDSDLDKLHQQGVRGIRLSPRPSPAASISQGSNATRTAAAHAVSISSFSPRVRR